MFVPLKNESKSVFISSKRKKKYVSLQFKIMKELIEVMSTNHIFYEIIKTNTRYKKAQFLERLVDDGRISLIPV